MLRRKFTGLIAVVFIGLLSPMPSWAWQGRVEIRAGVPHILNPAQPSSAPRSVELRELWRVGDDFGEGQETLGFVTDVLADEAGNSYLLDSSYMVIRVYDPDGNHLRDIGSEGEGPGEFRTALDFLFLPDEKIGVVQIMPAKVVTLDRLGIPGERFDLGGDDHGMSKIERAESAGEHLVVGMMRPDFSANAVEHVLSFRDARGRELQSILKEREVQPGGSLNIGGQHAFEFTGYWTLGADGHVYVAPEKDAYRIEVYDLQGQLERVIEREYESLRRSPEELAADRKRSEKMAARFGGMVQLISREYERDIEDLYAREDGKLWVASSRGARDCPPGEIGLFDVFDREGRLQKQVSLVADYDAKRDDFILAGRRLYVLKEAQTRPASISFGGGGGMSSITMIAGGGEDEETGEPVPPAVICYELPAP